MNNKKIKNNMYAALANSINLIGLSGRKQHG